MEGGDATRCPIDPRQPGTLGAPPLNTCCCTAATCRQMVGRPAAALELQWSEAKVMWCSRRGGRNGRHPR